MRFVFLSIVLAFPVLDLYATVRFARWTGVPVWVWIGMSMFAGFVLLQNERGSFRAKTFAAMHGEEPLLRGLVDSGRKVLAGLLFLLPGVLSDLIAILLLAFPVNLGRHEAPIPISGPRTWDGRFRRVD